MAWIWTIRDDNPVFAHFLHEENETRSSEVSNADLKVVHVDAPILYSLERGKNKPLVFFDKFLRLPNDHNSPLIHDNHIELMRQLFDEDVQFLPARILTKSEPLDQFWIMRPIVRLKCVDVEKTEIDWLQENEFFMHFENLTYLPNCLGNHNICQEYYTMKIVISNYAKEELVKFNDGYLRFVKPEDYV